MKLLIVTGMSGAGKSHALKKLEDMDWFCVDNLPVELIEGLFKLLNQTPGAINVALGIDSRAGIDFESVSKVIVDLKKNDVVAEILFLDASDETLVRRYSETRRTHPLSREGLIADGISIEREKLFKIRKMANFYINSTNLKPAELGLAIENLQGIGEEKVVVVVRSFGFKNDLPTDADMILDVRFVPNPFWIKQLKSMSGLDKPVQDYVLSFSQSTQFIDDFVSMSSKLISFYAKEGKHRVCIAFGCTGGRHRSVCIADKVGERFNKMGIYTIVDHRDINKESH